MKRCRFGAAALVLLMIFGLLGSRWFRAFCDGVAEEAEAAATAAREADWPRAEALTDRARDSWDRGRSPAAVLSDHDSLEQVDTLLALLDTALVRRDGAAFADVCTRLVQMLNDLSEAHRLSLENLL